jgi:phage terminase large subunit-like protein
MPNKIELAKKELELLKAKKQMMDDLPHLYGFKWYPWAREFFESRNRLNFLCAGNQLSKSSTQIRKAIDWATNRQKWPKLWQTRPLVFWYLYPTKEVATIEFEKKWVEEFLPKNSFKGDSHYGWEAVYKDKYISAINFNSKVSIYFKTYAQQVKNLQSGTVHAMFTDEEMPYEIFPELRMRISATRGYFHMVFTATLGQQEWKDTVEPDDRKRERFKDAAKWQVSYYDSQHYEDGTPSQWTDQRIEEEKKMIGDQREIDRRIYGKFVLSTGLKYPGFERSRNYVEPKDNAGPPAIWPRYVGVDIGSGLNPDKKNNSHPAAIVFIAVRPDYKFARIYRVWRGDDERTTAGDVLNKFIELRGSEHMQRQFYDWQCKDFSIIAQRMGEPFEPAEKGHDIGENTLNTLFRHGMLVIDDNGDPEMDKLVNEFCSLKKDESKQTAKDDLIDATRYGCTLIPWNFSQIRAKVQAEAVKKQKPKTEQQKRREYVLNSRNDDEKDLNTLWEDEIAAWNDYYEV